MAGWMAVKHGWSLTPRITSMANTRFHRRTLAIQRCVSSPAVSLTFSFVFADVVAMTSSRCLDSSDLWQLEQMA